MCSLIDQKKKKNDKVTTQSSQVTVQGKVKQFKFSTHEFKSRDLLKVLLSFMSLESKKNSLFHVQDTEAKSKSNISFFSN